MNIIDYIIIGSIIIMALLGLKRGAIKSVVYLIALVIITIVSYQFRPLLGKVLLKICPKITLGGELASATSLNTLIYQGIAFVILFLALLIILAIIIKISGLLDLVVKFTFILEIPSKLIGLVIGALEGIIIAYVGLFIAMQIPNTQKYVMESKYGLDVLEKTPIIGDVFEKGNNAAEGIYGIIEKRVSGQDDDTDIDEEIKNELQENGIIKSKKGDK